MKLLVLCALLAVACGKGYPKSSIKAPSTTYGTPHKDVELIKASGGKAGHKGERASKLTLGAQTTSFSVHQRGHQAGPLSHNNILYNQHYNGGYNQRYNGGYNQYHNGGYNQYNNGGYNQYHNGGYNQYHNGGYNQYHNGGYNQYHNGGYNQHYNRGYNQYFDGPYGPFDPHYGPVFNRFSSFPIYQRFRYGFYGPSYGIYGQRFGGPYSYGSLNSYDYGLPYNFDYGNGYRYGFNNISPYGLH